jgi:hypothetical protein
VLVQNVFAENNVVADNSETSLEKFENGSAAKGSIARSGTAGRDSTSTGKEALYVVAEPEQIIAAFRAMLDREDAPVRLSVESPLEIAALSPESRKRLDELTQTFLRPSLKHSEAATSIGGEKVTESPKKAKLNNPAADPAKADPLPAPPGEGKNQSRNLSQGKESRQSDKSSAPESEAAGKRSSQTASRQFIVPVPRELEERQSRVATIARRAPEAPARDIPAPPAPRAQRVEEANVDGTKRGDGEQAKRAPALVQVLIVIELETASPAAPALQPAAGKGPPGGGA